MKPRTQPTSLGLLTAGHVVWVIDKRGKWRLVSDGTTTGWTRSKYLKPITPKRNLTTIAHPLTAHIGRQADQATRKRKCPYSSPRPTEDDQPS